MRFFLIILTMPFFLFAPPAAWCAADSSDAVKVEIATGPDGLLQMEQQGKVTVRALRGWGRLPDKYVKLALRMRQDAGIDLLEADLARIRQWAADPALAPFREELDELTAFLEGGGHLAWAPVDPAAVVPAGALLRSGGKRWIQAADGRPEVPNAAGQPQASGVDPAQAALEPSTLAPPLPTDAGPEDGLEFPINDQVPGTFRVKLRIEGLQQATAAHEPWFERVAPNLLPENPSIAARERGFFENRASFLPDPGRLAQEGASYHRFLGVATLGTPVVIRVEAPENPAIPLSDQEVRDKVAYRVVGKSVLFFPVDQASGASDIGFEESHEGTARWTPSADAGSGRPVGPRAVGVYMAYQVKKYVGNHELGVLKYDYRRIGWVLVAMPGDVYEHDGRLYAVGQRDPLSTSASSALPPPMENPDFELPPYALKKQAVWFSEDLRQVAWVEGEEDGKKRVVINGVAGSWYDDIMPYGMGFSPGGDRVCFQAEMGDKEVLVCNGAQLLAFDEIEFMTSSPDGGHLLVGGRKEGSNVVYLDGKEVRRTANRLAMSAAAVAHDGKAAWVERGKIPETGAEFAMVVREDGSEGRKYRSIVEKPLFTKNRAELWYIAEKEGGNRFLVRSGEELRPTMGSGYKFTVTSDGAHYAFVAPVSANVESMVIDGQIGPEFHQIWNPAVFSPDGSRHIYSAYRDKQAFLVVDGRIVSQGFGPLESISGQVFSPDGGRWAAGFRLNDEDYAVVVDGKEVGRGKGSPRQIVFSPDGARVAWLEKGKKRWRAYLDGQAGPEFREIYDKEPPQFSPDGKHLVYFARDNDKKMHIVVFGGEDRAHDVIPPRAVFTSSGAQYLAVDGNRLRKHVLPLP